MTWYLSPSGWPTHADDGSLFAQSLAAHGWLVIDESQVAAAVAAYNGGTPPPVAADFVTVAEIQDPDSPASEALRAASVAAVQEATEVILTGDRFGLFGAGPSARIPFAANPEVNGPTAALGGSENLAGFVLSPIATGDFAGVSGVDPGYWWGENIFARVGEDVRNLDAATGSLVELAVTQDGGTLPIARGMETGLALYGPSAAVAITQGESLRVSAPTRKGGATGGTITNVYGLFVEEVIGSAVGATGAAISLFVAGGVSRFLGRVDVEQQITSTSGLLKLSSFFADSDGATLYLDGNDVAGTSGSAVVALSKPGSRFAVSSSGMWGDVFNVGRDGALAVVLASTTTAPAAGGAGALPATPAGYATVTINGVERKWAYY